MKDPILDPIIRQYDQWAYPQPIVDLNAYREAGGYDYSDPQRVQSKLFPFGLPSEKLRILVAGCGSNQAAVIAHANPKISVLGIDLSDTAIASHERLVAQHQLSNLTVRKLGIEQLFQLGEQFDYVICTGVLHHLADPEAGLKALKAILAPHGVISAMVYGQHHRAGVYMVQEALRELGAERTSGDLAFAREVVAMLPEWHHVHSYIKVAPDLKYDAGFVDTFLNARDRAYTVPQILALADTTGLAFHGWLHKYLYSPFAVFGIDHPIHNRIHDLAEHKQWHIVDLLGQVTGTHRFLLCHPDHHEQELARKASIDLMDATLLVNTDLRFTGNDQTLTCTHGLQSFSLTGSAAQVLIRTDGRRTVREVLESIPEGEHHLMLGLMRHFIELDHFIWSFHQ